ncbi:MAG: RluA family pseudouridine synthase [Bacilli bacterium]|nr:RluA family pseudouridine synthase [Bacilli bacterium]
MVGGNVTNINILYEDNHLLVVEKPINMLSQADSTKDPDLLSLLKDYIKEKYHKPGNVYLGLVHRLDRMVGGVMVFAKTSKAAARLSKMIKEGDFNKTYIAICHGKIDKEGKFTDKIEKLDNGNSIVSEKGKEATLTYELLEYDKKTDTSVVKIKLLTGRHHQIRVQFSSRGFPLLGDHRYGVDNDNLPVALYAYKLEFVHPVKQVPMKFEIIPKNYGYFKNYNVKKML